jgi:hypothetical protein
MFYLQMLCGLLGKVDVPPVFVVLSFILYLKKKKGHGTCHSCNRIRIGKQPLHNLHNICLTFGGA